MIGNHGGGIFRKIATTRELPELERYFACETRLPLAKLAEGYGLAYLDADSPGRLAVILPKFIAETGCPALLDLHISQVEN